MVVLVPSCLHHQLDASVLVDAVDERQRRAITNFCHYNGAFELDAVLPKAGQVPQQVETVELTLAAVLDAEQCGCQRAVQLVVAVVVILGQELGPGPLGRRLVGTRRSTRCAIPLLALALQARWAQ